MATVVQGNSGWAARAGNALAPGQSHRWIARWFGPSNTVSITVRPVAANPDAEERALAVEDLRIEAAATGRRAYFTVRNIGSVSVPGYSFALRSNP